VNFSDFFSLIAITRLTKEEDEFMLVVEVERAPPPSPPPNIGLTERRKTKREEGKVAVMAVLASRGMG
jgi:hypothetical protein